MRGVVPLVPSVYAGEVTLHLCFSGFCSSTRRVTHMHVREISSILLVLNCPSLPLFKTQNTTVPVLFVPLVCSHVTQVTL